jgi:hypothetical protein
MLTVFPASALLTIAISIDLKGVLAAVFGGMLGLYVIN